MRFFGHKRPTRDEKGEVIETRESPVKAITREVLGASFGADRDHRLIVSLDAGDLITLRPERTSRPVQIAAADLYRQCLMYAANCARLEKARARKATKALRLAQARQQRAEKRLFKGGAK